MLDALGVEAWVPISSSSSVQNGGSACPSSEAALGVADAICHASKAGQTRNILLRSRVRKTV